MTPSDSLIVGGGPFGAVFANEAHIAGKQIYRCFR